MRHLLLALPLLLVVALLPGGVFAEDATATGLTLDEILKLKEIGFTDEQILAEVRGTETRLDLGEAEEKRLREAGFAPGAIAALKAATAAAAPPAAAEEGDETGGGAEELSVEALIALKEMGFSEEAILDEARRGGAGIRLTPEDIARLREAGFSPTAIAALRGGEGAATAPDPVEDLLAMVGEGKSVEALLDAVGRGPFPWAADRVEALRERGVPVAVLFRLRGEPLTGTDAQALAAAGTTEGVWERLLAAPGVRPEALEPMAALRLVRAGVPASVVARLRETQPRLEPGERPTPPLPPSTKVATEVLTPPVPGLLEHVGGRFAMRYPAAWKAVRALENGAVQYFFTPGEETHPHRMDLALQIAIMPVPPQTALVGRDPVGLLKHLAPLIRQWEPELEPVGEVRPARLGTLDAAAITLEGTLRRQRSVVRVDLHVALQGDEQYFAAAIAPKGRFGEYEATFREILDRSRFGRVALPRLDRSLEARHVVEKYGPSTVSVVAMKDGRRWSTGTGWIVTKSGYVLTNWHVVFDEEAGRPHEAFVVEWDPTLKIRRQEAELVRYRVQLRGFAFEHGTDIALLKIRPGDYEPLPLTPLADVKPGDGVVTLGFPSRSLLTTAQALTVTRGVVTRFNRDALGNVVSIFTDAAITHGSSGGPCVSLVTGGAIGLNTFGTDIRGAGADANDLVNYFGVVPVDTCLKEFPLVCELGRDHLGSGLSYMDCFELARLYQDRGSVADAVILANRACELKPGDAETLWLQAHSRLLDSYVRLAEEGLEAFEKASAEAAAGYEAALRVDPEHGNALTALAQLRAREGRFDEAVGLADRAIRANPEDWSYHEARAQVAIAAGRYADAVAHAERAQALVGGTLAQPYITAGLAHYGAEDWEKGRAEFDEAVHIHRYNLDARIGVGLGWERQGETDRALTVYEDVALDFPENARVEQRIGETLFAGGRKEKAIDRLIEAVSLYENAGETPPNSTFQMLVQGLAEAKNPEAALRVCGKWLGHLALSSDAAIVHLRANELAQEIGVTSLGHAHLRMAGELANDDEVKKAIAAQQLVPLTLNDIGNMLKLRYHPNLVQVMIVVSPLAFTVQSEEDVRKLQEEGIPDVLIRAMLTSQERHGTAETAGKENDADAPAPQGLVGTWRMETRQQGGILTALVQYMPNGRFASRFWTNGQLAASYTGTWEADGRTLTTVIDGSGLREAYVYELSGDRLLMDVPGLGRVTLLRQADVGGAGSGEGTGTASVAAGLVGRWVARVQQQGVQIAMTLVFTQDGRYSAATTVNGQLMESDQGTWSADGRTLATTDQYGQATSYPYVLHGANLTLELAGMGRLTFQRQ